MSEEGRPDLATVLDHYEVQHSPFRSSQMVKCPLHEDRTPSCSVETEKGLWKCHSCGKGGDTYTLIMEKEDVNFVRARSIAASLGLATGGAGGSDSELSGSRYGGRRKVSRGKGNRPRDGGYVPAWKRR